MAKRPVEIADLYELKLVDEPAVDPDGCRLAYTMTSLDRDDDCYRSRIWIHDVVSATSFALTGGRYRDSNPAWSPDGTSIAFISNRDPQDDSVAQVFVAHVAGGEPRQLTCHAEGVDSFEWSPGGDRLLFVARVSTQAPESDSDVRVVKTARFRGDGAGYYDERFKQIFLVDLASAETTQVTAGPYDHVDATWSPNGVEIACVSNRRDGWEFSSVRDIYLIKTESGHIRRLTGGDGRWSQPSYSADGRRIAAYGTRNLQSANPRNELFVLTVATRDMRSVTTELDVDFRDSSISDWNGYGQTKPIWIDDERVMAVAGVRGMVCPAQVELESGRMEYLAPESGRYGRPQPLADGSFVAVRSDFTDPGEVVQFRPGQEPAALTSFNRAWVEAVELASPEALEVTSPDGEPVAAWLMRPAGIRDGERVPLLLEIHGGPFGMYADTFMHEFHLLAALGYGVLFANPRGSAGYGERFAGLLLPEMGENDLPDLMAAVDRAVAEPWVDEARLGVLGGSYGGFMTNWVVAHSDRFRAAVTQRTISDWYSTWGTDDIFYADENVIFGATPWEDPDLFYRLSPISYVDQMHTPLLIMHSEEDYRCPIPQGEELFIALKQLGRTVEFVRVPDESHGLSRTGKPAHRVERLKHILRWFETHL